MLMSVPGYKSLTVHLPVLVQLFCELLLLFQRLLQLLLQLAGLLYVMFVQANSSKLTLVLCFLYLQPCSS